MNRNKVILVVDDDCSMREILPLLLQRMGHRIVAVAENGEEALSFLSHVTVSLVISDVEMPEKCGLQMLREMRDAGLETPVFLMSGGCQEEIMAKVCDLNAPFFRKPLDFDILFSEVNNVIN